MLPTVMVTAARIANSPDQSCISASLPNAVYMILMITANAAALDATDRNAATGVGAP